MVKRSTKKCPKNTRFREFIAQVDEALTVAVKNSNVCFDICGKWELVSKFMPAFFYQVLAQSKMTRRVGKKILFRSDWPMFVSLISLKGWVEAI